MSTRSHLSIVTKNMGSKDPNTSNKRMISTKTRSGRASPNGIEARLSSSSSSSDSDTPKTPDHDCDDIEQETISLNRKLSKTTENMCNCNMRGMQKHLLAFNFSIRM